MAFELFNNLISVLAAIPLCYIVFNDEVCEIIKFVKEEMENREEEKQINK